MENDSSTSTLQGDESHVAYYPSPLNSDWKKRALQTGVKALANSQREDDPVPQQSPTQTAICTADL